MFNSYFICMYIVQLYKIQLQNSSVLRYFSSDRQIVGIVDVTYLDKQIFEIVYETNLDKIDNWNSRRNIIRQTVGIVDVTFQIDRQIDRQIVEIVDVTYLDR